MSSNTSISDADAYEPLLKPDTNNATYIGWDEISESEYWLADTIPRSKRKYWEYQNQVNSGLRNGTWWNDPYETYRTNRDLILNLTSHVHMRSQQRTRALDLITRFDLQKLGLRAELVAFCICAYVVHETEKDPRCGYPTKGQMENVTDELRSMQDSLGITDRQFQSTYGKVQHRDRTAEPSDVDHDKYEVDSNAQQQWRSTKGDSGEEWL